MSDTDLENLICQCSKYLSDGNFPPDFATVPPERATRQLLTDQLLDLLGWSRDPSHHSKQVDEYGVAEIGRKWTDYALIKDSRPYIFVEVKPLWEAKLDRHSKQLIEDVKKFNRENPARRTVYWGILTNFREVQIYYYDDPKPFLSLGYEDYEERWQLLKGLLSPPAIDRQELEKYYRENSKRPLDDEFLDDLKKWRLVIANGLYQANSELTITQLKESSQRLLDRLVLIRILETSGVLPYEWLALRYRGWREGIFGLNKAFSEVLREAFREFESIYDTELFGENEVDHLHIGDKFLRELTKVSGLPDPEISRLVAESQQSFDDKGLYGYNFNLLTVDIMGSVYERYLAHSIAAHEGKIVIERRDELRKKEGIYYTPPFVVNHIVENELASIVTPIVSKALELLEEGQYGEAFRKIRSLSEIRVLDPAFGSGSFLIRAFDTLSEAYDRYNERLRELRLGRHRGRLEVEGEDGRLVEAPGERVLLENLYGVDLDSQAVEIGKLNLWGRLLRRYSDYYKPTIGAKTRKLLPNLEINLKQGNSIIGPDFAEIKGENIRTQIRDILRLREELRKETLGACPQFAEKKGNVKHLEELLESYRHITHEVRNESSKCLEEDFGENYDNECPFVWEIEFPEVFLDEEANRRERSGFQVIVGNPPYGADLTTEERKHLERHFTVAKGYKNTAGIFIERCIQLLAPDGRYGMIVPKSMTFSQQWADVRKLLSSEVELLRLVDVSKAFKGVLLEQVILSSLGRKRRSTHFTGYSMWDGDVPTVGIESAHIDIPFDICTEVDCLLVHIAPIAAGIYEKAREKSILMKSISETSRGLPWQKYSNPENSGEPVLRGNDVSRFLHEPPSQRLDSDKVAGKSEEKREKLKQKKILSQRIVAHVTKPHDHLIIMSSWDDEGILTLDTVENTWITSEDTDPLFVLAFLNSSLVSWIAYMFVFNKAIRTMDLDEYYLGKLPVALMGEEERGEIVGMVRNLLRAHQQYQQLLDNLPKDRRIDFLDLYREKEKWHISALHDTRLADFDKFHGVRIGDFNVKEAEKSLVVQHENIPLVNLSIEDDDFRSYLALMFEYWRHEKKNQRFKGSIELPSTLNLFDEVRDILIELEKKVGTRHILKVKETVLDLEEEINHRIFEFYGLNEEERGLVEANSPTTKNIF